MTLRYIPVIPAGSLINENDKANEVSANNKDLYLIQPNFQLLSSQVTGSDGEIYTWRDDNHRTSFNDNGAYHRGNPSGESSNLEWELYDKVGKHGAYICKLGFGIEEEHRWLPNVVGFDMNIATIGSSTAQTNDPFVGKIGLVYIQPQSQIEYIYLPKVSMKGTTGDIPHSDTYTRIARKIGENTGPWNDIHQLDLRFTGFIFEWGHGGGGGAVQTDLYLYFSRFKPITSLGVDKHVYNRNHSNIGFYELVPTMRRFSNIDNIEYQTFN